MNIYVWSNEWLPDSNTIAYWKLDWDTSDSSNNWYDLSVKTWSMTYWTLTSWEKYWIFNGSTILNTSKTPSWTKGTVSFYVKKNDTSEWAIFVQNVDTNNSDDYTQLSITQTSLNLWRWANWEQTNTWSYTMWTSSWHHVVLTQDWTNMNLYIDWVSQTPWNNSSWFNYFTCNQLCIWWLSRGTQTYTMLNWYLSNVIIENRVRTATQVQWYFNSTKANYWIS